MSRATPQLRRFADRVVVLESRGQKSSEDNVSAVFHACERLRPHLVNLMGNTGFLALLSRAVALAGAEVPWLRAVQVPEQGALEKLDAPAVQVSPDEIAKGRVVLLAQLFGLLVAFIGVDLTIRLAQEVWPKLSLDDLTGGKRRKR